MHRLKFGYVLNIAPQSLQLKGFNFLPTAWIFKIFVAKQLLLGAMKELFYDFVKKMSLTWPNP